MSATAMLMTTEDLLALPDDGKRRWLIDGELRENGMTIRNRFHSATMANITGELYIWIRTLPEPRGQIVCGEAGVILPREYHTTVGVDVAYVPPDVVIRQTDKTTLIDGIPTLIVEILSPSDTVEILDETIAIYRAVGVPLVWIVDPKDRTVTVYRPGEEPMLVNVRQELAGGDVLPGFRVAVGRFFE